MNDFWTTDPAISGGEEFVLSHRLWPDPFKAPGVPPPRVLLRLAHHPEEDPELAEQVRQNMEARRALFSILSTSELSSISEPVKPLTPIAKRKPYGVLNTAFGEIRHTSPIVEFFDGEKIVPRRTWNPPMALVICEPEDFGFDTVCRAVLCSIEKVCDYEILECTPNVIFRDEAGFSYVAHMDLEYPVSLSQLGPLVGCVASDELAPLQEAIAAHSAGVPHIRLRQPSELSASGLLIYSRLLANADWLAANATSRRALHEADSKADEELQVVLLQLSDLREIESAEQQFAMAAAGGDKRWTTLVMIDSTSCDGTALQLPDLSTAQASLSRAELTDLPFANTDGSATGQWIVSPQPPSGAEFFLINKKSGLLLGAGHVQKDGVLELKNGTPSLLQETPESEYLLIVARNSNA